MTRAWVAAFALGAVGLGGACSSSPGTPHKDAAPDVGSSADVPAETNTPDAAVEDERGDGGDAAEVGAPAPLFGAVDVELITDDHTAFGAAFLDAPLQPTMPLDVSRTSGDCRLLVARTVSCAQGCPAGSLCIGADVCAPKPVPVNAGTLHVEGLGSKPLDLEPINPNKPSYAIVPTLPYPACAEGDDVSIRAAAFSLAGKCVGALVVTTPPPIPVVSGQAMHLAWTPPGHAGISRVAISLEISHHGGYKGQVDCDVADTGAFDIPEPLVTQLVALGRAGYPTVKLARVATATAPGAPGVRLEISSRAQLDVDTGVISCGNDASPPCPTGTTCGLDYTCK